MFTMLRGVFGLLRNSKLLPALLRRRPRSLIALLGVVLSVYGLSSNNDAAAPSPAPAAPSAPSYAGGGAAATPGRIFASFCTLRLRDGDRERTRPSPVPPAAKPASARWRTIRRVVDGDTLILDGDDTVRLMGVDAPEGSANEKMAADIGKMGIPVNTNDFVQLGRASAAFTKQVAEGRRCWLSFPGGRGEERDQYGRLLAYVHFENGMVLNEAVIGEGYGKVYLSSTLDYTQRYVQLQTDAQRRRRGLWGIE